MNVLRITTWLVFLLTAWSAQASIDVSCVAQDCFTEGWRMRDTKSLARASVECVDFDCRNKGWYETGFSGQTYLNRCLGGGCWVEGWEAVDLNGRVLAWATCHQGQEGESDCLTYGWTVRQVNGTTARLTCIDNNCRDKGWEIHLRGGAPQSVICKPGGCFVEGWRLYY
ncbi:MAG: hypothetical protein H6624_06245 [Bdellovibrionaceae bacterium]|nr:hypothetical protein [Bdellovibrionales bacterium]MCB9083924.1 hypothetical protein [Pseudobdellovibrionaceae bacterium]